MRDLALFLFSHRTIAVARWDLHFLRLRLKSVLFRQREAALQFAASRERPTYLNLGSGPRGLDDPHWINVDGFKDRNVHFLLDFNRGLPFADESVDGVFCEHVLEHFSLEDGERLLREVRRCLRPGGIVRIIVPDAERIIRAYAEAPEALAQRRGEETAMEAVNSYFRQRYEHQFLYDWPTLRRMLTRAAFEKVQESSYQDPMTPFALVLDDPKYEWESLYVNALK